MATQIYLGNPPENIKKWIKANYIKPWPEKTSVVYSDGTTWEGLIEGNLRDDFAPNKYIMKEVVIGNKVSNIDHNAFSSSEISSVSIPDSVTSIGYEAFFYCTSLTQMVIPSSVLSIGHDAFGYDSSLTSVTFKGKTLEEVQAMQYYPWGINDTTIIKVES